jgi:predicted RNA binding protein YcfA (HicA-like mRNA interferase family)
VNRLPVISGRDFVRAMAKLGFVLDRQKGSQVSPDEISRLL